MSAVRPLDPTPHGVAAVRATLGAAFVDDPMLQWIFPHSQHRAQATAAWLGIFVEAYSVAGVVDVVHDPLAAGAAEGGNVGAAAAPAAVAGLALWRVTDAPLPFSQAPSAGGLLSALVGTDRAAELGEGLRAFAEHKPAPPFHYLQFLAVHPSRQGAGLGRRLVLHGQQRAAQSGVGVYLESTNPRNLPFYRSLGFQQIGGFTLAPDGPPAFRLWWQE